MQCIFGHTSLTYTQVCNMKDVLFDQLDNSEDAVEFECNRWLDVKEDDGLIVREITAGGAQMLNSKCHREVTI